jgi:hypothetical protein
MGSPFDDLLSLMPQPTGLAAEVASKAEEVAQTIGGAEGFGGVLMNGYTSHMDAHMGFHGMDDLADPDGHMTIQFLNDADQDGTFRLAYMASHLGPEEQVLEVSVAAGAEEIIELPCSEIVGLGSLTVVGEAAVRLSSGMDIDNRMCVPGFLGADYGCDGVFRCLLAPDSDDVDGDGDTDELMAVTETLEVHMGAFGMMGRGHR